MATIGPIDHPEGACHHQSEAALGGELAVPLIRNPL